MFHGQKTSDYCYESSKNEQNRTRQIQSDKGRDYGYAWPYGYHTSENYSKGYEAYKKRSQTQEKISTPMFEQRLR